MSSLAATWVSAIGSAGAFLAFAAYVWLALLNRRDEAERYFEAQAHRVAAWLDEGWHHDRADRQVVCIRNGGEGPAFASEVWLPADEHREHSFHINVLPPQRVMVRPLPTELDTFDGVDPSSAEWVPELMFTDTSARRWHRDSNGVLSRVDRPRDRLRKKPRVPRESKLSSSKTRRTGVQR